MSWSMDTTVKAALLYGIPGTPELHFSGAYPFTGYISAAAHTLYGVYECQYLIEFENAQALYNTAYNETVFIPNDVYEDVVVWKFYSPASSFDCYIQMVDSANNVVHSIPIGFSSYDTNYKWYSFMAYTDVPGDPIAYAPSQPIGLALVGNDVNPNTALSMMWVSSYTEQCTVANGALWQMHPTRVNNLGNASFNYGSTMDYIDKLFNGVYDENEGRIAPQGGAGGGGGGYFRPNETVGIPSLPAMSVCDTGMISVYNVDKLQLQALGQYMWDPSFFASISKMFASPIENIITLQSVPINPYTLQGTASNIVIGNVDTGVAARIKLSTTYYEVNCGTIAVKEYYKSFADYAPYVQTHCFIPYVGIIQICPDDIMDGYLNIVYHIDVFSGSGVAFVNCATHGTWHVLSQHACNVCSQYPISGANFSNVYIGAINSINAVAHGNPVGALNSAMGAIKPEYGRSGGVTSVSGLLGIQKPYIIYSTPKYITAANFGDVKGYTSNLTVNIGSQSGYLQATADNSELSGISNATADELEMIRTMLADGIYV